MYKLLIVDDEKMIRFGIRNGVDWEALGIGEIYTAASAREAIEIIEKERPQIMLTDISMTEMTGLDLINHIRNRLMDEEMRIIVLTGYDRFDYARQCLQMRVQNFLLKPIDEDELKENVRRQLEALEEYRIARELEEKKLRTEGSRRQTALEQFLRDLVEQKTGYSPREEYARELEEDKDRMMQAAILIPDVYLDSCQEEEQNFRRMTVKQICMDLIDARRAGLTFPDREGRIVLVLYNSGIDRNATELAGELCQILEDEYDIRPRMVLGSEVEGLNNLYVSYHDALHLLEQERKGFREIVKPFREQNRDQMALEIYQEFKKAMLANLADADYVLHVYEKFCQAVVSYNISKAQVRRWCFSLASDLYFSCMTDIGTDTDGRIEELMRVLSAAGKDEALEVTGMFLKKLFQKEETEQNEIIARARRYIDEHLDGDLSVTNLADQFFVSPNYFSRLFKRVMQEGCNEYVVKKRIEKSRYLLETTTIKAGKIAAMVGYHDTNYFSLAFKKHTGMSPTRYRETAQKKNG